MALLTVPLVAGALSACGATVPRDEGTRAADTLAVEGAVVEVGSHPLTQLALQPAEGRQVAVVGPLRDELSELIGFQVRVHGAAGNPAPPLDRSIVATRYDVLAFRGEPVYVGTLRIEGQGARLEGDRMLQLGSVPAELRAQDGARIYLLGPVHDGIITVTAFGIIRPAGR